MKYIEQKQQFTTIEVARMLNISRIAVFKKIKSGALKAFRKKRNYSIHREDLLEYLGEAIGEKRKNTIEQVVRKAVSEYRQTFEKLGKE